MGRRRLQGRLLLLMACGAPAAIAAPAEASVQASAKGAERTFSIPAGPLARALQAYSAATGVQLVYSSELVDGLNSPGVSGRMSAAAALSALLSGTGLNGTLSGNTATISGGRSVDGERVTTAVRVEGAQGSSYFGGAGQAAGVNGINGSSDITATEGTGSFTSGALTIGSKVPQALKDVPQSISILTQERMEQQNVTNFESAMRQLPGVSLAQGGTSLETVFYSRGFELKSIQVDGGAPLTTGFPALGVLGANVGNTGTGASGYFPMIDLSQYDHVEILRGAAGTFNGYGDPSGTVNLVRKKPLDHGQVLLSADVGSWGHYRTVADVSSPLGFDDRLRGRLVVTWQKNRYFYDLAKDQKTLIYGIAEFDLTPTLMLTAGVSQSSQNSRPWSGGLPRFQNGDDLELPRSTSFVFPWNRWNFDTTEFFGGLEKQLGGEWLARLNLTYNRQSSTRKVGYTANAVNVEDNSGPRLRGSYSDFTSKQFSAEFTLTGAFNIFGQRQEVAMGINRSNQNGDGYTEYLGLINESYNNDPPYYQPYPNGPIFCYDYGRGVCPAGSIGTPTPPINVFDFDPSDPIYTEPPNPLVYNDWPDNTQIITNAYVNLRLTAFDRLHLTTGLRWSHYDRRMYNRFFCSRTTGYWCTGKQIGDVYTYSKYYNKDSDLSWPPAVSLSYDITDSLTGYVGYTDIYESQANLLDTSLNPIAPITGSNVEGGLKWSPKNGRLNVSLAGFRIRKKGFGFEDVDARARDENGEWIPVGWFYYMMQLDDGRVIDPRIDAYRQCCYISNPDRELRSTGLELDVTGELLPGWQMAANYTYNKTKQIGAINSREEGGPIVSIQPKNLYKMWTSYDFGRAGHAGWLSGLTLSGGVNGQSSAYKSGRICVNYLPPDPITKANRCAPGGTVYYDFTVPSYAVVSGRIDYRFSDRWSAALNIENIFDKTYYQTTGDVVAGNWYGKPRSFLLSVRAKW